MKIINCPLNGPQDASEFHCGGEVVHRPDVESGTDREWSEHLFLQNNPCGMIAEWWIHVPSSYWFIVERDTLTDEIIGTFTTEDWFAKQGEPAQASPREESGEPAPPSGNKK